MGRRRGEWAISLSLFPPPKAHASMCTFPPTHPQVCTYVHTTKQSCTYSAQQSVHCSESFCSSPSSLPGLFPGGDRQKFPEGWREREMSVRDTQLSICYCRSTWARSSDVCACVSSKHSSSGGDTVSWSHGLPHLPPSPWKPPLSCFPPFPPTAKFVPLVITSIQRIIIADTRRLLWKRKSSFIIAGAFYPIRWTDDEDDGELEDDCREELLLHPRRERRATTRGSSNDDEEGREITAASAKSTAGTEESIKASSQLSCSINRRAHAHTEQPRRRLLLLLRSCFFCFCAALSKATLCRPRQPPVRARDRPRRAAVARLMCSCFQAKSFPLSSLLLSHVLHTHGGG